MTPAQLLKAGADALVELYFREYIVRALLKTQHQEQDHLLPPPLLFAFEDRKNLWPLTHRFPSSSCLIRFSRRWWCCRCCDLANLLLPPPLLATACCCFLRHRVQSRFQRELSSSCVALTRTSSLIRWSFQRERIETSGTSSQRNH